MKIQNKKRATIDFYTRFPKQEKYIIHILPHIDFSGCRIKTDDRNTGFHFIGISWLIWSLQINITVEYENTE